ncbi:MAG: CRTAC1 family protein [Vicinamibacterales bacterium]
MRPFAIFLAAAMLVSPQAVEFEPMQADLFATAGAFVNAWGDYDGDNDADLFVGFNGTPNRLYRNQQGVFVDVATAAGLADARPVRAAAWGDMDGNGYPDLLVGFSPGPASLLKLYRNRGGVFQDVTDAAGLAVMTGAVRQPVWVDVDGDHDLDLFVAFRDKPNAFYRNDAGHFTDIARETGLADPRRSVGAVWFDADADGDLDVYVGNMDGDANGLFLNTNGRFSDAAEAMGVAWGGRTPKDAANGTVRPCAADVNNDGRIDLITANYGKNGLFLNTGKTFEDASRLWGFDIDARHDTCAVADVNNDGRLDVYVNGTFTGGTQYRDYLFINTGTRFSDATPENVKALAADHGASWADVDHDGDMDLALTGSQANGMHAILRNLLPPGQAGRSISVRVFDSRGHANRAGAEVRVYAAGTRQLIGTGLVDSGSGYDMQNDLPVHVGIGQMPLVDVEVTWPAKGQREVTRVEGVRAGARTTIRTR